MLTSDIHPNKQLPDAIKYLYQIHAYLNDLSIIDSKLYHLILLRASQINGCAFCIKMHISEALKNGEEQQRLDQLIIWQHSDKYSAEEKVAFAWVEALTRLHPQTNYAVLRLALSEYFNEQQISALTLLTSMINLWNRIGIAQH
ncbi:carboxymuconolactone decarboxylase family protein [Acinetobacter puyangensis]|uniref:carboxymuconolactone decarboxylase family protein n=1 Tax=Acinetobacter puyangensis TaxID=1096779 RepID=UPI003A4E544D